MEILKINICKLKCKCGWNVLIGGRDKKELKILKDFINGKQKELFKKEIIKNIKNHLKEMERDLKKTEGEDCEITKDYKLACNNIIKFLN